MDEPSNQTTLNIPSILAFAVISFIAIRYFFFSPSSGSQSSSAQSQSGRGNARRNFPAERVDFLTSMFPQLSRRDVEWDLVRNGGSLQATSDRVLREGRLPAAPPNFQPIYATTTTTPSSNARQTTAGIRSGTSAQQKQTYTDLITRYNLSSRISALRHSSSSAGSSSPPVSSPASSNIISAGAAAGGAAAGGATAGPETSAIQSSEKQKEKGGWSSNKDDRAALLKRRREDMILAARQKMEQRDRKGKAKEEP